MEERTRELLEAALSYARRGWRVVPLHNPVEDGRCSCGSFKGPCYLDQKTGVIHGSPAKHPRTKNGLLDATTDEATIRRWWATFPLANVGIATGAESGLFVLDIDSRHGGEDTLTAMREEYGPLPQTVTALTGAGEHRLFTHPGFPVRTSAGKLGEGLDTRGDGGYIVATPSLHISGRLYAWEGSGDPDEIPLSPAPAWLYDLLNKNGTQPHVGPIDPDAKIPIGRRREAWKTLAAQLHNDGVPLESKVRIMTAFAREMFESPETAREDDARGLAAWYEDKDRATDFTIALPPPTELARGEIALPGDEWPGFPEEAAYGLAGDVVRAIDPYTEADPVAILAHLLVFFGNCVGPSPHFRVGGDEHPAKLFAVLVGESSTGRKGTSEGQVRHLFKSVDPDWTKNCFVQGLASGEGLIRALAPEGASADSRAVVVEHEMANVLAAMGRLNSTLSSVIRQAWDKSDLAIHRATFRNTIKVSGVHVSMVTHITPGELLRRMDSSDNSNGFANRFLWFMVRGSKDLPDAPQVPPEVFRGLECRLIKALDFGRRTSEMRRDDAAADFWRTLYPKLREQRPGLAGLVTNRAHVQVIRLSLIYALLDQSATVREEHIRAARALWDFTVESAQHIFGGRMGDPIAQRILDELSEAENGALTRRDLSDALGRNVPALILENSLTALGGMGLIRLFRRPNEPGKRGPRPEVIALVRRN